MAGVDDIAQNLRNVFRAPPIEQGSPKGDRAPFGASLQHAQHAQPRLRLRPALQEVGRPEHEMCQSWRITRSTRTYGLSRRI
jgi:hypothetical protein